MSTLAEELEAAAYEADLAGSRTFAAALRARAAHARALLERAVKFRDNPNLPADNMIGPFVVSMLSELCGPIADVPGEPAPKTRGEP